MTTGFPNMLMVAGPQSVSGSTNYPQAIETAAEWVTDLLDNALTNGKTRLEASPAGETMWQREVQQMQDMMPFSKVQCWFTGFNPNAKKGASQFRYNAYWGGAPKYRKFLEDGAENYAEIAMD
jgi:cation diffusion facilitator CzcD-associated flavoprotein CzcO